QFFAPTKELADMDTGGAGYLRDHSARFKAGSNEPLLLLPRPASTALDRRDHFNRMLRHMTTPSATTRTSDVRINLARRPSPGAYTTGLGPQTATTSGRSWKNTKSSSSTATIWT